MSIKEITKVACKAEVEGPAELVDKIQQRINDLFPDGTIPFAGFGNYVYIEEIKNQIDEVLSKFDMKRVKGWTLEYQYGGPHSIDGYFATDNDPLIERAEFEDQNTQRELVKIKFSHSPITA